MTDQTAIDLLPCPFCGCTDQIELDELVGESTIHAGCENCGAVGPVVENVKKERGYLISAIDMERSRIAWNTRVAMKAPTDDERQEALERANSCGMKGDSYIVPKEWMETIRRALSQPPQDCADLVEALEAARYDIAELTSMTLAAGNCLTDLRRHSEQLLPKIDAAIAKHKEKQ